MSSLSDATSVVPSYNEPYIPLPCEPPPLISYPSIQMQVARPLSFQEKIKRIALAILTFFPTLFYNFVHLLMARHVVVTLSTYRKTPEQLQLLRDYAANSWLQHFDGGRSYFRRESLFVYGFKIDAVIFGKEAYQQNGRWCMVANGNGNHYEDLMHNVMHVQINSIATNVLMFNYPGVGESKGLTRCDLLIATYRCALRYIEEIVGAKEIMTWNISMGSAIKGEVLRNHQFKEGVKYYLAFDRPPASMSQVPSRIKGLMVQKFGWEMSSVDYLRRPLNGRIRILILQKAVCKNPTRPEHILDDGIISANASGAFAVLSEKMPNNIKILGLTEKTDTHSSVHSEATMNDVRKDILDWFGSKV